MCRGIYDKRSMVRDFSTYSKGFTRAKSCSKSFSNSWMNSRQCCPCYM
ncbi:unnamed protein product [Linum tenue]|uniref:Uncharacterized protein n=1 Tax=Linum tenue TaxID=586396 RepID=A0AAV0QPD3_9ROSI|nr:unnamed protein product [Linum tenue]